MCRNKSEILEIPCDSLKDEAQNAFQRIMGISKGASCFAYQEEEYFEVGKDLEKEIKIHAIVKKVDSLLCEKNQMWIEGQKIEHALFVKNFQTLIQDVYLFLVSIEWNKEIESESVMEQFLYHAWESAYLEAARKWLRQWIANKENGFVSVSLSPGFYGISLDTMESFYHILQGEKIGVFLKGGVLTPKQCVLGIYCVMKQEIELFYKQCDTCLAKGKHCEFCMDEG